jgi:serine/threonine protein phosphatase PrpC
MNISKATAKGLRGYQEDRFVVSSTKDGKLIAVMDGHGGESVSERIAKVLPAIWKKHIVSPASLFVAIKNTFRDINDLTKGMYPGSTFSLVFIPKPADVVYVAILGDSPVIVKEADGTINISPMHNARSNATELAAARARGAAFDGNYIFAHFSGGGIQMTRVMGDHELDSVVNREPEIYTCPIGPDSFVLVGSDGLFDPSNRNVEAEIPAVVEQIEKGASAQELVDRAIAAPTGDNVTAILVRCGNKKSRKKKKG